MHDHACQCLHSLKTKRRALLQERADLKQRLLSESSGTDERLDEINKDLKEAEKSLRRAKRRQHYKRDERVEELMREAYQRIDLAVVHRLALGLARSSMGPRKRVRNAVRATVFETEELEQELMKPATEGGGFGAQIVRREKVEGDYMKELESEPLAHVDANDEQKGKRVAGAH